MQAGPNSAANRRSQKSKFQVEGVYTASTLGITIKMIHFPTHSIQDPRVAAFTGAAINSIYEACNEFNQINFLKPHKDAKFFDHDFSSPTFREPLGYDLEEIINYCK